MPYWAALMTRVLLSVSAPLMPACWRYCAEHTTDTSVAPTQIKLGSLAGSMEAPACFGAEIYAQVRCAWMQCMLPQDLGLLGAKLRLQGGLIMRSGLCSHRLHLKSSHSHPLCCSHMCAGPWRRGGAH